MLSICNKGNDSSKIITSQPVNHKGPTARAFNIQRGAKPHMRHLRYLRHLRPPSSRPVRVEQSHDQTPSRLSRVSIPILFSILLFHFFWPANHFRYRGSVYFRQLVAPKHQSEASASYFGQASFPSHGIMYPSIPPGNIAVSASTPPLVLVLWLLLLSME